MARKKLPKQKALLLILDGFGLADPAQKGNAITPKTAPHIFGMMKEYPCTELKAHGKAVGLQAAQAGNSEAGHLNIGAGRTVLQDIAHVSAAIKDGTFFKNHAFEHAFSHVKKQKSTLHIMGLLTGQSSAHANPEHLYALLKLAHEKNIKNISLHLFTDGRDSSPHAAVSFLTDLRAHMQKTDVISSVMGRFYAMDRNKAWKRTAAAYDVLVGAKKVTCARTAEEAIQQAYNRGETDEYIKPTCVTGGKMIQDGDAVVFFNARSDRARQLAKVFVQKKFNAMNPGSLKRKKVMKDLCFVAMSEFGPDLDGIVTAFPSPDMENCLAKAIGEEYKQLFISETEKYAHVTYFLNGGYPKPINGEERELVHSPDVHSYANHPEMQTHTVVRKICQYLQLDHYDFICVNFPNADMVGHTGNFEAAKRAVKALDQAVQDLVRCVLSGGGIALITADHGNAEMMIDQKTGEIMTAHTTNPVPCIVVDPARKGKKMKKGGSLRDVAPTMLKLMGIKKPKEMTGTSLI